MPLQQVVKSSSLQPDDILPILFCQGKAHQTARTAKSSSVVSAEGETKTTSTERQNLHTAVSKTMGFSVDKKHSTPICFYWTFRDFLQLRWLLLVALSLSWIYLCRIQVFLCSSLPACVPITHYSNRTWEEPDTVGSGSALTFPKSYGAGANQETLFSTSMLPCASDCFNTGIWRLLPHLYPHITSTTYSSFPELKLPRKVCSITFAPFSKI